MPAQAPPKYSRGQITAEGVFAELATVKPQLEEHQRALSAKLIPPLAERAKNIISTLKTGIGSQQTLEQVSKEVATETVREVFENLGKIQDEAQIPQVLADSLAQSIVTHPNVNPDLDKVIGAEKPPPSADEEKIYQKAQKEVTKIADDHQADLSKAAVLQNLANLANESAKDLAPQVVEEEAANFVRENDLPDPENAKETLKGRFPAYTINFAENLTKDVVPQISQSNIPTLQQYQQIRTQAADRAIATVKANIGAGESQPDISPFLHSASQLIGFEPASVDTLRKIGVGDASPKISTFTRNPGSIANRGIGLALAIHPQTQRESFFSLISGKTSQKITQKLQSLKTTARKRALTFRERKDYYKAAEQQQLIDQSQSFGQKQAVKKSGLVSTFLRAPMLSRLDWVNNSWQTVTANSNGYSGVFVPSIPARKMASIMPTRFFGGQAARLGNFAKGAQSAVKVGELAGEGAVSPLLVAKAGVGMLKNMAKVTGGYLFGLLLYAWQLGQAALAGAIMGGLIGAGVGAGVGLAASVALCGPLFAVCGLVTVPAGIMIGGFVGATAGMLIGFGLAAGNTTAVATGVGAATGGTIGAVAGYGFGTTVALAFDGLAAFACATTIVGCVLIPVAAAGHVLFPVFFSFVGAAFGTFVGGLIGAAIGHWVIPAFENSALAIKNFFGNAFGTAGAGASGIFGTIGSLFSGLASGIWGGITSAAGGIFGGLSSIGSALAGLGSGGTAISLASVGVFGSIGTIGIVGTIVGITTAATFFNPDTEGALSSQPATGDNQYFTLTKTASTNRIDNPSPANPTTDITFIITLTAKNTNLTNISITDEMKAQGTTSFPITVDNQTRNISPIPCSSVPLATPTLIANQSCTYTFTITVNSNYNNKFIINTVKAQATPEGGSPISGTATVTVRVGDPPANCPSGWPTRSGHITQGPEGATSHGPNNWEAIDISQPGGTEVYATFNGKVQYPAGSRGDRPDNQVIQVIPNNCPGLDVVEFVHLNTRFVHPGETVTFGQPLGTISYSQGHVHYQFGYSGRSFRLAQPYVPVLSSFIRSCDDGNGPQCNVSW